MLRIAPSRMNQSDFVQVLRPPHYRYDAKTFCTVISHPILMTIDGSSFMMRKPKKVITRLHPGVKWGVSGPEAGEVSGG